MADAVDHSVVRKCVAAFAAEWRDGGALCCRRYLQVSASSPFVLAGWYVLESNSSRTTPSHFRVPGDWVHRIPRSEEPLLVLVELDGEPNASRDVRPVTNFQSSFDNRGRQVVDMTW
jgi:hypothetical protein